MFAETYATAPAQGKQQIPISLSFAAKATYLCVPFWQLDCKLGTQTAGMLIHFSPQSCLVRWVEASKHFVWCALNSVTSEALNECIADTEDCRC